MGTFKFARLHFNHKTNYTLTSSV